MTDVPPPEPPQPAAPPSRLRAWIYRGIGFLALGLAAVGVVTPLLPTTVFLLIALWAFARGSPEWAERVRNSRRFGPYVRDWETRGAIPRRAKILAVLMMSGSLAALWLSTGNPLLTAAVGALLAGIAGFILTRPS